MTPVRRTHAALATLPLLLGVAATGCSTGGGDSATTQPSTTVGSSTGSTTECPTPGAGANTQDTASYRMVVSASDPEKMLTQAQVDAQGQTEGELVIGGGMGMRPAGAAKANGHVEVAICDSATGKTVSGADVTMEIVNHGKARTMRVMEMRGLDEPVTASHYGNNTMVPAGAYVMRVTLNGESAEFPMPAVH